MSREQIEETAKDICLATQQTNYKCNDMCEKQGSCAYCNVIAEYLYNANNRKQSEWISVEERLPKEVEHIIVCDEDGTVGEAIFLKASRQFEWVDNEEIAFATHWMPLPEPPKKGGGEV